MFWGPKKPRCVIVLRRPRFASGRRASRSLGFDVRKSRAGLTSPQKKRKLTTPCSEPFSLVTGPNQLWCMDFKGYFATGDGKRCDPFTIADAYSQWQSFWPLLLPDRYDQDPQSRSQLP